MLTNEEILERQISSIAPSIVHDLERELSKRFDKCGLFYRVFSRCKSASSAIKKLNEKSQYYQRTKKKMQDLLGIRIVLYFKDDIDLCLQIVESNYDTIETVRDEVKSDVFRPVRLNVVCKMPDDTKSKFDPEIWRHPIDATFEIQIRTIFSEGWHEVEHDVRYKHEDDWAGHDELLRNLNGIFATLETCDWTILNVLDRLAYQAYKEKKWGAMLRNHLRIRMDTKELSEKIDHILTSNSALAKEFFRVDRQKFLLYLSDFGLYFFPKTLDNIVYLINALIVKDNRLSEITPSLIRENVKQFQVTHEPGSYCSGS